MSSLIFSTTKYILKDIFLDILRFPLWWYTDGVTHATRFFVREVKLGLRAIGLRTWVVNIFKPMFGDYSREGRLISFFMRLVQIIFRTVLALLWIVIVLILLVLWLVLPLLVVYQILRQL